MFAMYIEYSSTLHNGIQNVYFGANNTEEGLSPTKSILCVYMYTKCILWCFLVTKSAGVFTVFFV